MIPKKDGMTKDPEKYRPISLTSCLSKLTERLLKVRLYSFLEDNDVLVKQQAGFRNNKGASDNLTFFTQKLSETINRGKKVYINFQCFCKIFYNLFWLVVCSIYILFFLIYLFLFFIYLLAEGALLKPLLLLFYFYDNMILIIKKKLLKKTKTWLNNF